jgi:hypothetical protein
MASPRSIDDEHCQSNEEEPRYPRCEHRVALPVFAGAIYGHVRDRQRDYPRSEDRSERGMQDT